MKNFSFDGRLGKDAEVLTTKGGKPYVRFSVANNSFSGGAEKTEWIDVTSYDQYVVENRAKYLTKGTYVIVNGDVRFDVAIRDGKVWKNIYVTANAIDTPNFGKKDDSETEVQVATSTVQNNTTTVEPTIQVTPQVTPQVQTTTYQAHVEQPAPAVMPAASSSIADDDLPF